MWHVLWNDTGHERQNRESRCTDRFQSPFSPLLLTLSHSLCVSHWLFIMHPIFSPCAGLVRSHYARSHLGNWAMQSRVMYVRGGEAQWPASLSISPNPLATENTYLPHLYLDFTNVDISEHNHCYPAIAESTGAWTFIMQLPGLTAYKWCCCGSQHVLLTISSIIRSTNTVIL